MVPYVLLLRIRFQLDYLLPVIQKKSFKLSTYNTNLLTFHLAKASLSPAGRLSTRYTTPSIVVGSRSGGFQRTKTSVSDDNSTSGRDGLPMPSKNI